MTFLFFLTGRSCFNVSYEIIIAMGDFCFPWNLYTSDTKRSIYGGTIFKKKWVLYLGIAHIAFDLCHPCTLGHLITNKQSWQASLCQNRQPVFLQGFFTYFATYTRKNVYEVFPYFETHTAPSLPPPSMCVCVPAGGCYSPLWPVVIRHFFPV